MEKLTLMELYSIIVAITTGLTLGMKLAGGYYLPHTLTEAYELSDFGWVGSTIMFIFIIVVNPIYYACVLIHWLFYKRR